MLSLPFPAAIDPPTSEEIFVISCTGIQYQIVGRDSLARCPLRTHYPFRVGKPNLLRKAFFDGYSNGEITTIPPAGRLMLASTIEQRISIESHNQVLKVEQLLLLNGHLVPGLKP